VVRTGKAVQIPLLDEGIQASQVLPHAVFPVVRDGRGLVDQRQFGPEIQEPDHGVHDIRIELRSASLL
jgi:hypothetical protein